MTDHEQKTKRLQREVADFYKREQPFYIFHGSTNSTRYLHFDRDTTIDVSDLDQVLEIDTKKQVAITEPNVPMDALVRATLPHGLVPKVVMEFPGITVGGGIQGFAGESSSYKWGVFHATCQSVEMILANGDRITASAKEQSDLYYGAAGSFGSLGIVTQATVELMPARRYVALTYIPVSGFDDAIKTITKYTAEATYDYIDGIMYNHDEGVIMLGTLQDEQVGRVEHFTRSHDEWFYLHAQKISHRRQKHVESIPLTDYLFRYDRGGFWVGKFPFERAHWPFNRFTRWLVDPMLHTRKLYEALHASGASQQYIIQDLAVPVSNTVKFMEYIDKKLHAYPLWLCPLKLEKDWIMLSEDSSKTVINVGVWDNHEFTDHDEFVQVNRDIEKTLRELNGQKWFYAHAYYTEEEFWSIYDRKRYDALRKKYHATTLPTVYEKIRSKGRKSVNIKKASVLTLFGKTKLKIDD